jgi:hypothetical protein
MVSHQAHKKNHKYARVIGGVVLVYLIAWIPLVNHTQLYAIQLWLICDSVNTRSQQFAAGSVDLLLEN